MRVYPKATEEKNISTLRGRASIAKINNNIGLGGRYTIAGDLTGSWAFVSNINMLETEATW